MSIGLISVDRKEFLAMSVSAFRKWRAQNATLRAAALAFFTIFPLPSLLLITTALCAQIFGQTETFQHFIEQITTLAGPAVAELLRQFLESTRDPFTSIFASIASIVFTIAGAIGAFLVLQDTLNVIWEVPTSKQQSLKTRVNKRTPPFLVVSFTGLAVIVWTGIITILFGYISFALEPLIGNSASVVLSIIHIVVSFTIATLLFAIMYKQIPDTVVKWGDVRLAAIITSVVFTAFNYFFGIYVQLFPATSMVGIAGSMMVLLTWIFIAGQFIFFGAQFSKIYAETKGSRSKDKVIAN